jgi:quinohemoprotein ethanol dehydrogenase
VFALAPEFRPQRFRSNTGWTFAGFPERRQQLQRIASERRQGWLTAWDPVRQREVWRVPYSRPGSGGTLVTAGNIVFQGTAEQTVAVYRADDGEKLWDMPVQTVPMAGPVTYTVDGEQYIAVNAGWGGGMAAVERMGGQGMQRSQARLVVFRLGGTAELPPLAPDESEPEPPPPITASEDTIQRGATLYSDTCAVCHGPRGISANSDLRFMDSQTRAEFADIVLRGIRASEGMARFDDLLDENDVAAIYAYLVARANEDWGEREARPADPDSPAAQ